MAEDRWWAYGNYNGDECANCGRQRVMLVDAPEGEIRLCEKCHWSPDRKGYVTEAID